MQSCKKKITSGNFYYFISRKKGKIRVFFLCIFLLKYYGDLAHPHNLTIIETWFRLIVSVISNTLLSTLKEINNESSFEFNYELHIPRLLSTFLHYPINVKLRSRNCVHINRMRISGLASIAAIPTAYDKLPSLNAPVKIIWIFIATAGAACLRSVNHTAGCTARGVSGRLCDSIERLWGSRDATNTPTCRVNRMQGGGGINKLALRSTNNHIFSYVPENMMSRWWYIAKIMIKLKINVDRKYFPRFE